MWKFSASKPRGGSRARRFVDLTRPHLARLWQLALLLSRDSHLAEDILQQALLKAFRAFGRFHRGTPAYPWLASILRNAWIDHSRQARLRRESYAADALLDAPDPRPSPEQQAMASEQSRRLERAVECLPEELALAVVLVDFQGLSYTEAAEAMQVPAGTVRSRLARGRLRLRELMIDEQPAP